ncbi:GtrA family protein [Robbsia sp. Bb-Pol-6]|uniref:GtrA family protein n=1 Tax=Robbsia betulipollinis TaxID=2981849 RepID=A0ABT3ZM26_9BURK|nr:GtrA family protein [Robbsia betulipollinis]MCY0387556.1 GtrA family protein [Robbsia betulipollinis]
MIGREIRIFILVGIVTVLIDFTVYRGIVWLFGWNASYAKGCSFLAGTVFSYFANRALTFGHARSASGSGWRFGLLYALTLGANIVVNAAVLKILRDVHGAVGVAFVLATGTSTVLNFIGMKWFVFRTARPEVVL